MNHFFRIIFLLLLCQALNCLAIDLENAVPDFDLAQRSFTNKTSDYKGKWLYLDFWASWCAPCRQSFPWMNEMQHKYAGQNIEILAVNVDAKKEDAERFLLQNSTQFGIAYDPKGTSAKLMGLKSMPTSFLIDPNGKVKLIHIGFRNEERDSLEKQLKNLAELH
jgi:thiol-disulfide isomerase/thioredoxin